LLAVSSKVRICTIRSYISSSLALSKVAGLLVSAIAMVLLLFFYNSGSATS
jgi:hypothetical protein